MPEPVFSSSDRVEQPVRSVNDLPAELKGVTDPVKIAEYYQTRETKIRQVATEAIREARGTPPTTTTTTTTNNEKPMTAAEVLNARQTLIATAKREASIGTKYWERLLPEIEAIMKNIAPEEQVSSATWETAYNSLVGQNLARLQSEDATAAAEATRIASERTQTAAAAQATPEPLPVEVVNKILPGLDITEDQYRQSEARLAKKVQDWPMTFDSKHPHKTVVTGGNQ